MPKVSKTEKMPHTSSGGSNRTVSTKRDLRTNLDASLAPTPIYKTMLKATEGDNAVLAISRLRDIGNSRGIILNNQLIEKAGFTTEHKIAIEARVGMIVITVSKPSNVNTDLKTWDKQFRAAFKAGDKPEKDLFEGVENEFDKKEW